MKPNFLEFVHEKTYPRPRRADHLGENLVADFRYYGLWPSLLAEIRHQQK